MDETIKSLVTADGMNRTTFGALAELQRPVVRLEDLLRKYIALVKFHERIDYIDRADKHDDGIDFSEDELAELRRLSALTPPR